VKQKTDPEPMIQQVTRNITCTFLIALAACNCVFPQGNLRIVFYNVENMFDIYDDPLTNDEEFLPESSRHWNIARYQQKLNSVYKVIALAGGWEKPALIGLCEIENRKVLDDLLNLTPLNRDGIYQIIHKDSYDPRGIDVCLIYRKDCLNLLYYNYLYPKLFRSKKIKTRNVLYSKWLAGNDTIHLFLNHWPSRRGGVLAGEEERVILARMIKEKGDSILRASGNCAKIIFAGDFNSLPSSREITIITGNKDDRTHNYVNLCSQFQNKAEGTYKFKGVWETPDQIIVSNSLLSGCAGLVTAEKYCRILSTRELLIRDRNYPGYKPFPTFNGFEYLGGYSDHLPLILDLIASGN